VQHSENVRNSLVLITKPLLYRLSYVGGKTGKTLHPAAVHTSALLPCEAKGDVDDVARYN
jgi:hypothetical protein